jgi:hypothetical protein
MTASRLTIVVLGLLILAAAMVMAGDKPTFEVERRFGIGIDVV